jgi:outer membrane lipoprotein-sorting protein
MKLSNRARWTVPVAGVAATGAVIAGVAVPSAQAASPLPAKTPAQLLALVGSQHKVPPLTGTVVETTSLGLPQLPQTGNPTSLSSLLTGSHTVTVYWQDAKHFRLAVPQTMSETDIMADGNTAWLWESSRNTVTKFNLADAAKKGQPKAPSSQQPDITKVPLTPQQAANQILAAVGKTTIVSARSNVTIAGEAAYQLVLAPRDHRSTIGSIVIGIDGKTGVPLSVQVIPAGSSTPAFQVGFQSISYTAPNPKNFTFTPPSGATVTTPGAQSAQGTKQAAAPASQQMGTYGKGWLSVAELPESDLLGGLGGSSGAPASGSSNSSNSSNPFGGSASQQAPGSAPAAGNSPSSAGSMLGGNSQEIVNALLGSGQAVSGSWGKGQLVHTSLLNILITGGNVYVGAVDPKVLEAAVGHTVPAGSSASPASGSTSAAG